MTVGEIIAILEANNTQIAEREFYVRGQIEALKEELLKLRAKQDQNVQILAAIRGREASYGENPNTTNPDSTE